MTSINRENNIAPKGYTARTKKSAIIQHILKNLTHYSHCDIIISVQLNPSSPFYFVEEGEKNDLLFIPSTGAISGELLSTGTYEATSMTLLRDIIKHFCKDFVFVDVGANIGLVSRQILKLNPHEIFCYEANKNVFYYLEKNINPKKINTHLINSALWKDKSDIVFNDTIDVDGYGSINSEFFTKSIRTKKETNTISITPRDIKDEIKLWKRSGKPIIYKSDIQGCDLDLLSHLLQHENYNFLCSVIEVSANEFDKIFNEMKNHLITSNSSILILPDKKVYKLTEQSAINTLQEKQYKYADLITCNKLKHTPWYQRLPEL